VSLHPLIASSRSSLTSPRFHRSSITTKVCKHIVLDAGHIAISSDLVSKQALAQIEAKKEQKYTDEDFLELEALMFDRFDVRFESAQVRPKPSLLSI
jgi:vacuolar protein sorting-associated protein 13A/C